jgi:peptidoglycan/LPS O-acetylase OafA/YrhL
VSTQRDTSTEDRGGRLGRGADFNRNNLDCLRLILAAIVVLFHVDALTNLPAFAVFGEYCSPHFPVKTFFVISGLLIYRSYLRSSSVRSYLSKRARRIYPGYFAVIVATAFGLYFLSSDSAHHYFGSGFWKYFGANLLFLNFAAPSLPGVFTSNPMAAVDGALWTLKIEVAFYLFVPLMHLLCSRFGAKKTIATIFLLSSLWKYGFEWLARIHEINGGATSEATRSIYEKLAVQFPAQLAYFTAGILLLLYFDRLKQHFRSIAVFTVCLYLADKLFGRGALDLFWISGLVLVFGFWFYLGNFSKHGDFSYGVYIVHWPILQTLILLGVARYNAAVFLILSIVLVGLASLLLWNVVEKRFLKSSSHYRRVPIEAPAVGQQLPV